MFDSAVKGDAQSVTAWLDKGGGVDARCAEREGATLLMAAAAGGHEAMMRMLLQRGASVNLQSSRGVTALMAAATKGHATIVQALLDAKADASLQATDGGTALMVAELHKHAATAQLLRQHAERQEADEAEARAAASATLAAAPADAMAAEPRLGEVEAKKEAASKTGEGKKTKSNAAPSGAAAESTLAALPAGGPETEGLPVCVSDAAYKGDAQAVAAWLDAGGGVDAGCAQHDNATLLIAVTAGGHEAMVRMLLQRGANINLQTSTGTTHGTTALMAAASLGQTTIVHVLLNAKADASMQDISGRTALMRAEQKYNTATVQVLLQHAKRQATEAEVAAAAVHAATPDLSGRVRIAGLMGRPDLNGRCGVAGRFDAAKGRYEVAVEGEAEAILLKTANLQQEPLDSAPS